MFWIGLIVGIVIGGIAMFAVLNSIGHKVFGMNKNEYHTCVDFMYDVGHNRESSMTILRNDGTIDTCVFEEK